MRVRTASFASLTILELDPAMKVGVQVVLGLTSGRKRFRNI